MRKVCLLVLAVCSISLPIVSAQQKDGHPENAAAGSSAKLPKLPAEIRLVVTVEESPGIDNPKSFWEGVYEIRVANWSEVVERTKSRGNTQELGEGLLQSSFPRRRLLEKENRCLVISVPVSGHLLERLQNQSQKPQAFLLKSTIRLFDAQLNRNYPLEVDRVWQAKLFPDGEASIELRISPDGSDSSWGPVPKQLPAGYTIVGAPSDKSATPKKP